MAATLEWECRRTLCKNFIEPRNRGDVAVRNRMHALTRSSFSFLDHLTKYYLHRAKLMSKREKHPNIVEYALCVKESDAKTMTSYKMCVFDLVRFLGI